MNVVSGDQGLPGLPSSCSSELLPLQTPFAGQGQGPLHDQLTGPPPAQASGQGHAPNALEGFQRLDPAAQIAVLQRLTAAKADAPDSRWLQARFHQLHHTCCICTKRADHGVKNSRLCATCNVPPWQNHVGRLLHSIRLNDTVWCC